jgi:putative transposase
LYITLASPWENPLIESFDGEFRAECLDRYLLADGRGAHQSMEQWRIEYNAVRPHRALGYLTLAEFARHQLTLSLSSPH